MIIYIAGKYANGRTELETRSENIWKAKRAAITLLNLGVSVICPHTNTAFFDDDSKFKLTEKQIIKQYKKMMNRCDVIFMLSNWENSKGAREEHEHAIDNHIPIFYTMKSMKEHIKSSKYKKCAICGITRTRLARKGNKRICLSCFNSVCNILEKELEYDKTKFLKVPQPR